MLRNDLIVQLSGTGDNDTVTVDINGTLIDIEAVKSDRGIVIVLNGEDLADVLGKIASGKQPLKYAQS